MVVMQLPSLCHATRSGGWRVTIFIKSKIGTYVPIFHPTCATLSPVCATLSPVSPHSRPSQPCVVGQIPPVKCVKSVHFVQKRSEVPSPLPILTGRSLYRT